MIGPVVLANVYRGPGLCDVRIEACACGGHISAAADLPLAIAAAVLLHNRTAGHLRWATELGFLPSNVAVRPQTLYGIQPVEERA